MIILSSRWRCGGRLVSIRGAEPPGDGCQLISVNAAYILPHLAVTWDVAERLAAMGVVVDREWYFPTRPVVRFIPSRKMFICMGTLEDVRHALLKAVEMFNKAAAAANA